MKSLIKSMADEFGFTQQQIADYFGIHFSIVSRIRSGDRKLPAKAIEKGSLMLQAIHQLKTKKKTTARVSKQELRNRLQLIGEQVINCQIQIRQLKAYSQKLKQQHEACNKTTALVDCLAALSKHGAGERHKRWMEQAHYDNNTLHKKCGAEQQWLIELKLKALEAQRVCFEEQASVIKHQINNS